MRTRVRERPHPHRGRPRPPGPFAHPAPKPAPGAPAAPAFASSFESGDPRPDWGNTVETGPDGEKHARGVDSGYITGLPASPAMSPTCATR